MSLVMDFRSSLRVLLLIGLWTIAGLAQNVFPSEADYVLRAAKWQAVVLGDYVYLDGGAFTELGIEGSNENTHHSINRTLSFDLRTSWSTNDVNPKQTSLGRKPLRVLESYFSDPESRRMYKWGGQPYDGDTSAGDDVWEFEADGRGGGAWGVIRLGNQDVFMDYMAVANAASVTTPDAAFIFGGHDWEDEGGSNLRGFYKFNFTTQEWSLEAAAAYSDKQGSLYAATATYVSGFGSAGLIFLLGGIIGRETPDSQYASLDNVWFYDIGKGEWHNQKTSGYGSDNSSPDPRRSHCAVGAQSSGEERSFEIFVFGGLNSSGRKDYGDVWILSIPGFHWTRARADESNMRRAFHTCAGIKSNLLSFGGIEMRQDKSEEWWNPDHLRGGLGIFDMNALEWTKEYNPEAESYTTHERVKTWYDEGKLANVSWDSDTIEALFTLATEIDDDDNTENGDDEQEAGSSIPVGAIVGGTLGGVAALTACGGVAWYLLRRKRKQSQSVPFVATDSGKIVAQQIPEMSLPGRAEPTPYSYVTSEALRVTSPSELPGSDAARPPFEMGTTRDPAA